MEEIFVKNLHDLEQWLDQNSKQKSSVWLVHYKFSSGLTNLNRENLVDTLLCYGWIDSLPGKVDEVKTKIRISPRNPKSAWSQINKEKVNRLIKEGKIKTQGLEIINLAKQNGSWDKLNNVDKLIIPEDLHKYLSLHNLHNTWHSFSNSKKRGYLEFLQNRKSPQARENFIKKIFETN